MVYSLKAIRARRAMHATGRPPQPRRIDVEASKVGVSQALRTKCLVLAIARATPATGIRDMLWRWWR